MILPFEPTQENIEWLMSEDNHFQDESSYNKLLSNPPYKLITHFGFMGNRLVYQFGEHFFIWDYTKCKDTCTTEFPCECIMEVINYVNQILTSSLIDSSLHWQSDQQ